MKKFFTMLVAACFLIILLPETVSAASDGDPYPYNPDDIAAIRAIIEASPTLSDLYDKNDPTTWADPFVIWEVSSGEYRVTCLSLVYFNTDGERISVGDFSGTLDASKLTALRELDCCENNSLTSLVLPASDSLFYLCCYGTGITQLDLSALPNLASLICYKCPSLMALDVSRNTKLDFLNLSNTSVSSIDLSQLPELGTLWCSFTNITALDISQNTKLHTLRCNDTAIASLDLSHNPDLKYLECSNTRITALDITQNSLLKEVNWPSSCLKIVTGDDHTITVQQTTGGSIHMQLISIDSGDSSTIAYVLNAKRDPGYRLVRFIGVTNMIPKEDLPYNLSDESSVVFRVTGDMTLSAEFAPEERLLLSALSIEGVQLSPAFSSTVFNYTASVGADVTQINILAQGIDPYEFQVEGDGIHPLKVGKNTFVVTIIVPLIPGISDMNNPDETLRTNYTITVTREGSSGFESESDDVPDSESESVFDDVPKTGDDSFAGLWFGLMLISIATLTASIKLLQEHK